MSLKKIAVLVAITVATIFAVFPYLLPNTPVMKISNSSAYNDMKVIRKALFLYEREKGHLPFDARGSAFALYRLKPFFSEFPSIMPSSIWNEEEQMLDAVSLQYRNEMPPLPDNANQVSQLDWIVRIPVKGQGGQGYLCLARDGVISFVEIQQPLLTSNSDKSDLKDEKDGEGK